MAVANPYQDGAAVAPIALRIRDIGKSYGGNEVLRGCTFDVMAGGVTALVGPNGAGKTTLFDIITGFTKADHGQILLGERDISGVRPERRVALGVARTFQLTRVFLEMTALENVLLALPRHPGTFPVAALVSEFFPRRNRAARDRAIELLGRVGLEGRERELVGVLGYAEQKLVSLAQLLATESRILLLDEPAAGLDRTSVARLLSTVRDLTRTGYTVLLVEHSVDVIAGIADQVVFLHRGMVQERGTAEAVLGNEDLKALYFGLTPRSRARAVQEPVDT
jgi:ABC-type branched-subunit amino acid transport system ATPase component